MFELGEIYVKVDIKSLTSDTIVIENVEVSKPVINYEMLSLTRNNISDIQNNIKKNTAKTAQKETAETEKTKASSASADAGKKVIIKKLTVKDGEINAVAVKDSKKGEPVSVTISKVIGKILNTASSTVVSSKISDLKGVAQKNLEDIAGGVKDRVKSIGIFGK